MKEILKIKENIIKHRYVYLLLAPGVIYLLIFSYIPMSGMALAFQKFSYGKGFFSGTWVGLANFRDIFRLQDFRISVYNTFIISFLRMLFEFPMPIILALILNEVRVKGLKRFYQTVFTFPNFLSWVVVYGIMFNILRNSGILNQVLISLGQEKQQLLMNDHAFRPLIIVIDVWKSTGWISIIYLAAISSIDPELYSAAIIDGAGKFQCLIHITWPGIRSTAAILLILSAGNMMNAGFDQIFNMYNPVVYGVSDIIDTYIYRRTFVLGTDFSSSTAVGLFKSVINFSLLFTANILVKKLGEESIL